MSLLNIQLVRAWPERQQTLHLQLAPGSTVRDALAAAGDDWLQAAQSDDGDESNSRAGIWGKRVELAVPLSDGDRVELYRPLTADPKLARQRRASEQGYRWQGRTRRAARTTQ